jgi:NAD(P)-dependent dehydrogenase (short-subunit alcohol dehydrogenase family)
MTCLIYGGTGGIGSALARVLVPKGRKVHLVSRDAAKLAVLAQELDAGFTAGDVRDPDTFTRANAEAGEGLSGLAYCVGSINLKPFHRLTKQDFLDDFLLNASGAAQAVQASLLGLKAYGGTASVLLFSTVAVAQGFTAHASVAMAKGAVEGLTLALAAELAPKIRVNCIAPSLIKTPLAKALTSSEPMATAIAGLHALQRLGEPEDIAPLAGRLLSDEAGWITGQIIGVDGGRATLRTKG